MQAGPLVCVRQARCSSQFVTACARSHEFELGFQRMHVGHVGGGGGGGWGALHSMRSAVITRTPFGAHRSRNDGPWGTQR